MGKDFFSDLNKGVQNKQRQNLEFENKQLKEKISNQELKLQELRDVIKQEDNNDSLKIDVHIYDIKTITNIRKIDISDPAFIELKNSIQKYGQLQAILLSKDNFLLAGYRRYTALKELNSEYIKCIYYEKNLDELKDILEVLQFEENEKRQNLDNFEISEIFNSYLEKGYKQTDIAKLFNKKKQYISNIIKLINIDDYFKDYIKEFQSFGFSYDKFKDIKDPNSHNFLQKTKGTIIGWNLLYKIACEQDFESQKKVFLSLFKNRLSDEELIQLDVDNKEKPIIDINQFFLEKTNRFLSSIKSSLKETDFFKTNGKISQLLAELEEELRKL